MTKHYSAAEIVQIGTTNRRARRRITKKELAELAEEIIAATANAPPPQLPPSRGRRIPHR